MPLLKGKSPEIISKNIKELIKSGKRKRSRKQIIAIAISKSKEK